MKATRGGFWAKAVSTDQVLTAVQRQGAACDISGTLAHQPGHHVGDLLALAQAADGDVADDAFQHLGVHGADHFGVDIAGRDAVDGDALPRILQRQGLGEADHPGLGGGIVGLADLALLAVDRGDVDDAAMAPVAHAVDDLARHVEDAVHIDADHVGPLVVAHLVEEAVAGDAGVVDQDVDGAELILDLLHGAGAVVETADIALDHHDVQRIGDGLGRLVVSGIAGGDLEPVLVQALNDRLADAPGPARYESHARHVVSCPLPAFRKALSGLRINARGHARKT